MCVCKRPKLVGFFEAWRKVLKAGLTKGSALRAAYDAGTLVLQFRFQSTSLWCAMPSINLTTLIGSFLKLCPDSDDAFARMAAEIGNMALEIDFDGSDRGLGCASVLQEFSVWDLDVPCTVCNYSSRTCNPAELSRSMRFTKTQNIFVMSCIFFQVRWDALCDVSLGYFCSF
jgi:hypothetical protein